MKHAVVNESASAELSLTNQIVMFILLLQGT